MVQLFTLPVHVGCSLSISIAEEISQLDRHIHVGTVPRRGRHEKVAAILQRKKEMLVILHKNHPRPRRHLRYHYSLT
jgi:hypothetical protein